MSIFKQLNKYDLVFLVVTVAATCFMVWIFSREADAQPVPVRESTVSWQAVDKDVEGTTITGVTYSIFEGFNGAAKTRVQSGLTLRTFKFTAQNPGTYCYEISATARGVEGEHSDESCKSHGFPAPTRAGKPAVL